MKISLNEWSHYIVVYAALLFAWPQAMDYFGQDIYLTAFFVFLWFVVVDKLAHWIFGLK